MQERGMITMSQKELKRLNLIHKVIDDVITQVKAAEILDLSTRQVRRIEDRIEEEGDKGIIHKSRGRPSGRAFPEAIKDKVLKLCRTKYEGFSPTFASEKLFEIDKISLSRETIRGWFKEKNISYRTRKKRPHRNWRERKDHFGEMEQVDGSHHAWFEERGPECVLMAYIDDANNNVFARFYEYEGIFPFMDSFKRYVKKYGLPISIYIDKLSTYKAVEKPSIKDQLENREASSHVQRSLRELGVEVIYANSPQAKGRVERLFRTFQDRLIKEMRLKNIKTIKEANKFLECYLPIYNRRFGTLPLKKEDLHRPLPKTVNLDNVLCKKTERVLNNDSTVAHNKRLYHVLDKICTKKVIVEERINGRLVISYKGKRLRYRGISRRPAKKEPKKPYVFKLKRAWRPPMSHPYKAPLFGRRYPQINTYSQKEKVAQKEKGLLLTKS